MEKKESSGRGNIKHKGPETGTHRYAHKMVELGQNDWWVGGW